MTDLSKGISELMRRNEYHRMEWIRAKERIESLETMLASAMNAVEHSCLKIKEQGEARKAAERQLADMNEEIARLLGVAQKEPHTAYLEAVQRACDDRMSEQKHRIRELEGAAQADDRYISWLDQLVEDYRAGWVKAEDELAALRNRHAVAEDQLTAANEKIGALVEDKTVLTECNEAAERQLAELRAALQDRTPEKGEK